MVASVTVGVVGVGTVARAHLAVLSDIPATALAFVVDPDPAKAVSFKGTRPAWYGSVRNALADHQPDLVVITAPTQEHSDLIHQVLSESHARVLVEKPLVHDLRSLDLLRSRHLDSELAARVAVAHHFAFSPEVRWATDQVARHPEWGAVTRITSIFHDPYIADAEHSLRTYGSSWIDSGINQLSMLSRFVVLLGRHPLHETHDGASAWCNVIFRSDDTTGMALLRTTWQAVASSKRTTLEFGSSGVEVWLDHTAVTAVVIRDSQLCASLSNDGRTPRKIARYRSLYSSLLSGTPDPVLHFDTAVEALGLLYGSKQIPRGSDILGDAVDNPR